MLRALLVSIVMCGLAMLAGGARAQPSSEWLPVAVGEVRVGATEVIIDLSQARAGIEALRLESNADKIDIRTVELTYAGGAKTVLATNISIEPGRPSAVLAVPSGSSRPQQIRIEIARSPAQPTAIEIAARHTPRLEAARPRYAARTRGLDSLPPDAAPPPPSPGQAQLPPPPAPSPGPATTPKQPPPATRGVKPNAPANRDLGDPSKADQIPPAASTRGPGPADDICRDKNICTPVPVFFATSRIRETNTQRIAFGGRPDQSGGAASLGRAIVTVPKTRKTQGGAIERPGWYDILRLGRAGAEDPAKVFTIPANGVEVYANTDAFVAAVRQHQAEAGQFKDHAFIFVHGYNNTFDDALFRTAQIAYDLGGDGRPFGTAFLYSWPSGGLFNYVNDKDNARRDATRLRAFIQLVVQQSGARVVHLIAHSMGNVPMMEALENYQAPAGATGSIGQVILAAPDMDVIDFQRIAASIRGFVGGRVTLYANGTDRALQAARTFYQGTPRVGEVPAAGPVVAAGIDSIDITRLGTELFSADHALYAERKEIVEDIVRLMLKGEHPPELRSSRYLPLPRGTEKFWRYVP